MKFYNGEDGLAIMKLIIEGKTPEEAAEIVKPRLIEIEVTPEVEEFCKSLESE